MTAGGGELEGELVAPRLFDLPVAGLYPMELDEANRLLVLWGHRLGACERPYRSEGWALEVAGRAVAVAISATTVSSTVAGYRREEVVELARLGSSGGWANRVMLRLWREVAAPLWGWWSPRAAVSYSLAVNRGDLYRFDGWTRLADTAGSGGGGTWSSPRIGDDPRRPRSKSLWVWRYDERGEK